VFVRFCRPNVLAGSLRRCAGILFAFPERDESGKHDSAGPWLTILELFRRVRSSQEFRTCRLVLFEDLAGVCITHQRGPAVIAELAAAVKAFSWSRSAMVDDSSSCI